MGKNARGFSNQLKDLRSGIANLGSQCVEIFARNSPHFYNLIEYEKFCEFILNRENVHKALGSANKVIAGHAY